MKLRTIRLQTLIGEHMMTRLKRKTKTKATDSTKFLLHGGNLVFLDGLWETLSSWYGYYYFAFMYIDVRKIKVNEKQVKVRITTVTTCFK